MARAVSEWLLVNRRRSLLLGSAGLALILVAGAAVFLSTRPAKVILGGPIGPPTGGTRLCAPDPTSKSMTFGWDVLINRGSQVAIIESVTLRSPRNLRLVGSLLVPLIKVPASQASSVVGSITTYPPPDDKQMDKLPAMQWARREPPRNARLLPGHIVNAVLGLQPTGDVGSDQGMAVHYRVGNQQYLFSTLTAATYKVHPATCS